MSNYSDNLFITSQFDQFYASRGYLRLEPARITSRIDRTVYLTNSATNLFKSHFGEKNCYFARQKSMRTQILTDYYREETETEYPTYFVSFGAFAPISCFGKLIEDTIDFHIHLGFLPEDMRLRISSEETFLADYAYSSILKDHVFSDHKGNKFDHVYGDGVYGRAIKFDYYQEKIQRYKNLGYFLVIKKDEEILGCEYASSDQLILMRLKQIRYAIAASNAADLFQTGTFMQRRFADSLVGTAHLIYEGIRPQSSDTNGRTLKKYISALKYFSQCLKIAEADIPRMVDQYLNLEYGKTYAFAEERRRLLEDSLLSI